MAEHTTLTFLGAAGTVTGSKFLVQHDGLRLLIDCGLFQGEKRWRERNWTPFPVPPATIDAAILTHCHLDHVGFLPRIVREGFGGPVHVTQGTAELAALVLRDSAHLFERDAEDARAGGWSRHDPPLPLYTVADAEAAIDRFTAHDFDSRVGVAGTASAGFTRAGHVLGSASVSLTVGAARVLFSGDLGRSTHPLLAPRGTPPGARTIVVESTYGNRSHPPATGHAALADAIRRTVDRGGSVLIPAFAIDRTELVLHALAELLADGAIPAVPVYVNSPMALDGLAVYRGAAARGELRPGTHPDVIDLPTLVEVRGVEQSIALNTLREPSIIVSASGMATGGRVVHHLRHMLPDARNTVILTGYQAVGTRGRQLVDGAREIKAHGRYVKVRAEIVQDEEFSVHADADELLAWLAELPDPETVYVVHGEPDAAEAFAARIRSELGWGVPVAAYRGRGRVD